MTIDQLIQYENQGFLHLPGAIPPDLLARLRRAFDAASARYERDGRAFLDIPYIFDADDAFVDLVDLPAVVPALLGAVGPDVQLNHTLARLTPAGRPAPTPWRSDLADAVGVDLPHSPHFFAAARFAVDDPADGGWGLAFLPGSHRMPPGDPPPAIEDVDHSPAVVRVAPRAGDVVLYNAHIRRAEPDTGEGARRTLTYVYSHFWVKHYANAVPTELDRLANTPLRRQLFGVEEEGVSYFDRRFDPDSNLQVTSYKSLRATGQRLIGRLRGRGETAVRR